MKQRGDVKGRPGPTPAQLPAQRFAQEPSSVPTPAQAGWRLTRFILAPLRLFLGITFIYAGIQKLTDPQYFKPTAPGYIGKQILAFSHNSPIGAFLLHIALPHAHFFGLLVALGELAIGLGALFGFLLRLASFFGLMVSLVFFLSASWNVRPYFYGADIVFVFAWLTLLLAGPLASGLPSFDAALAPRLMNRFGLSSHYGIGRALYLLLGVGNERATQELATPGAPPVPQPQGAGYSSKIGGYPQHVPQQVMNRQGGSQQKQVSYRGMLAAQRREYENRRSFLWGLFSGSLGIVGLAILDRVLGLPPLGSGGTRIFSDDSASPASSSVGTGTGSTPAAGSGTPTVIAQSSQVATNSAVTFNLANGDPGVLIHLNNGNFVCYDATCTHAGCPVQFDPGSSHLICPCHGAEFDPANNAAVLAGPTNTPLTSVPIQISGSGAITTTQ